MTTASSLGAVRESLALALSESPEGSDLVAELAAAAVEHYALNYAKHPPAVLLDEIHQVRGMLSQPALTRADPRTAAELRRARGWLSALLGNLAFHVDDTPGARAHLAAASELGRACGDSHLTAWSAGAASMVARYRRRYRDALDLADQASAAAPTTLVRAQVLAWARLPALAALGQADDAEATLAQAAAALEADPAGEAPGRFGFDVGEFELHAAEAHLLLARPGQAARHAAASAAACRPGSPGWAAATVVLAHTDAAHAPGDAAARGLSVLDLIPVDRLRSTTRTRLAALDAALRNVDHADVHTLHERLGALPPPVDVHGQAPPPQ
jgi:hypothetical protein